MEVRKGFRRVHTPLERHPKHLCCAVIPPTGGKGGQQAVSGSPFFRGRGVPRRSRQESKPRGPQQLLLSSLHQLPGLETPGTVVED